MENINEQLRQRVKILIGIDPSFIKMGVCIYNPKIKDANKAMVMKRGDFMGMVKWINQTVKEMGYTMSEVVAVVENPNLDSTVFGMFPILKKAVSEFMKTGGKNWGGLQATFGMMMKRGQDVGKSKASGQLIIKMLRDKGVPVVEIAPSSRNKAYQKKGGKTVRENNIKTLIMPTKTTQSQFEDLTGYKGTSNEDSRDAATMVFGRSVLWAVNSFIFEEEKNKNKPPSYPSSKNGNEFLVNRETKIF
ncbi:MAG: hypothetical protein Unbinned5350contig1001_33 [Prokaryotic dsDNA virus sp.]|nr:MAG: hypothetical protein Unbinned5350contig1001_33 [Prokaryotic dsDNA virus sp.]|tara:strand:- start:15785 stop:16525 length:741 start_codon:yes stop_codon:yes gene_type:complete